MKIDFREVKIKTGSIKLQGYFIMAYNENVGVICVVYHFVIAIDIYGSITGEPVQKFFQKIYNIGKRSKLSDKIDFRWSRTH